ncbi:MULTISPECIES: MCE family protein [unclassified Nocardioides]|uniref:MCE family protein n=1 Tax=unclassified Nocardioides TaxID=2615069 RepID=UPI0009E6DF4C|nr:MULTISPECIES: MCE family protein [unclassified Nocardioides]
MRPGVVAGPRGRVLAVVSAFLLVVGLAGCSTGYKDLPLPGSAVGGETYQVSAVFDQALNLAQGAQVKVNGVSVGRVQTVDVKDFKAHVTMDIKASVEIPDDSSARLRYDTPLGELFIQVTPGKSPRNLAGDDQFPVANTATAPSVEDALASASTLINGGRLGELQVIAEELNAALGGREDEIRASVQRVTEFLRQANASRGDISRALTALRSVSDVLSKRQSTIKRALREVGPAVETLGEDTDKVIALLAGAKDLAATAKRLALKVDDPLLTILRDLGPIADAVLSTRSSLRSGLDNLIAVASQLEKTVPSEVLPLRARLNLTKTQLNLLGSIASAPRAPVPGDAGAPLLPGLDLLGGRR